MNREDIQKIVDNENRQRQLPYFFTHCGLQCCIQRNIKGLMNLNGYVGLRQSHPLYGKKENDPLLSDIAVHGGVTFAHDHLYLAPDNLALWWFGFDTAHSGDIYSFDVPIWPSATYKIFHYVLAQTRSFAEQLKEIGKA